ncbi:MAG: gamma-glutamyltransferase [Bryobacterales bacterium]|nr:gamma-glutamyltransferase [Bryobacterales bacterium]
MSETGIFLQVLAAAPALSALVLGADRPAGRAGVGRSAVLARNGMVAASQPLPAQAGLRVLQRGGNAFDAAVAAAAALAVVEPMMTGPGGDMFVLAYLAEEDRLVGLNGSGFSPEKVDLDFFSSRGLDQIPVHGPYSVTVPGAVDGWAALLDRYGAMPLAEVLEAPIEYAENGFPVSEIIAANWTDRAGPIAERKDFREAYLPGGRAPRHGEVFRNPGLAWTYRQIAEGGRDACGGGEPPRRIVAHLDREDWPLSMDDLACQHSDWVEPISTSYKQFELHELPPNGQGMAALEMLNILEGYDLRSLGHNSAAYLHLLLEAKKLAFADLDAWLADPQRAELPVETIISKDYAAEQRKRIRRETAAAAVESGISAADRKLVSSGDTVYLTAVDRDRNMVSFINSLFHGFGSGVTVPGTGIVLQNRGALFSLERGHPNRIEPRKRPYHTIIPAMASKGGKPWMSFGVMGGDMQPQGHVQIMLNRIEFGMNVQEAGEAARIKHNPLAGVAVESGGAAAAVAELDRLGHDIVSAPGVFGGYQAIEVDWERDVLIGGTDPRKDGLVAAW